MPQIETEYETTEGIILVVTADITPGRRGYGPSLEGQCEPDEPATIEIISVKVKEFMLADG